MAKKISKENNCEVFFDNGVLYIIGIMKEKTRVVCINDWGQKINSSSCGKYHFSYLSLEWYDFDQSKVIK